MRTLFLLCMLSATAIAEPAERRLHTYEVEASTFLWNDSNRFVENYHPNYAGDDDPATAWVAASNAAQWIRIKLARLDGVTKVRLRIRNGFQNNARARDITVRLLPSTTDHPVTLADKPGLQDVVLERFEGELDEIELRVTSTYGAARVAISDVQVFATSDEPEEPVTQRNLHEYLMKWRALRVAAAKQGTSDSPLYPAYEIVASDGTLDGYTLPQILKSAANDAVFAEEWKDALAIATGVASHLDKLTPVQIAPVSTKRIVSVHGARVLEFRDAYNNVPLSDDTFRLPMLGTIAALFADQLRVRDGGKLTVGAFVDATNKKHCTDVLWAARTSSKERTGPRRLQALVLGRCRQLPGRAAPYYARGLEIIVYDTSGKAVLVAGDAHVEGYRWIDDNGRPMIAGARALLRADRRVVEAKRHEAQAGVPSTSSAAATAGRAAIR